MQSGTLAERFLAHARPLADTAHVRAEVVGKALRVGHHSKEASSRRPALLKVAGSLDVDAAVLLEGIDWTEGETKTTPGAFTFLASVGPEQAQSGRAID